MMLVVLHIYRTINTTQYAVSRAWILAAHPVSNLRTYREYRVSNWCYSTCTCMICGNSRLRGWESSKVGVFSNIFMIGHVLARSLHFPVFIGGQSGARLACKCPDCPRVYRAFDPPQHSPCHSPSTSLLAEFLLLYFRPNAPAIVRVA